MNEGKVFIIDDDPVSTQLFSTALKKAGFIVESTTQVIGTTAIINKFSPDIILLDVMMPALSGEKMVQILKEGVRSQPTVILLSNKNEDELKKLVQESGADDYMTKLSGPGSLLRKVNEHIWRRKTGQA